MSTSNVLPAQRKQCKWAEQGVNGNINSIIEGRNKKQHSTHNIFVLYVAVFGESALKGTS